MHGDRDRLSLSTWAFILWGVGFLGGAWMIYDPYAGATEVELGWLFVAIGAVSFAICACATVRDSFSNRD